MNEEFKKYREKTSSQIRSLKTQLFRVKQTEDALVERCAQAENMLRKAMEFLVDLDRPSSDVETFINNYYAIYDQSDEEIDEAEPI